MIMVFLSVVVAIFSLNLFVLNYQIQGVKRTIINTPIQLIAKSIVHHASDMVYLRNAELKKYINTYYEENLSRYCNSYEVGYYFYNQDDGSYCTNLYCTAVEITVDCSLINNYQMSRTMYYEVWGG